MNYQEVFDRVTTHLLTQNRSSTKLDGKGLCLYRKFNDDGTVDAKCAIGCLIDDCHYDPVFEGAPVRRASVNKAIATSLKLDKLSDEDIHFLDRLQFIHDTYSPSVWRVQLEMFSVSFKLKFDPPTGATK